MNLDDLKTYFINNQRPILVGFVLGIVFRSMIR